MQRQKKIANRRALVGLWPGVASFGSQVLVVYRCTSCEDRSVRGLIASSAVNTI